MQPPNFDKERAYFQDVDAFDLLEESPSPKKPSTWIMGSQVDTVDIPHLSSVLHKWLNSKKLNQAYAFPGSLSKILETPLLSEGPIRLDSFSSLTTKTSGKGHLGVQSSLYSVQRRLKSSLKDEPLSSLPIEESEDIEVAVSKLSLTSRPSSVDVYGCNSFSALLAACGQSVPSTLTDMLLNYWFVFSSYINKYFFFFHSCKYVQLC